MKNNEMNFNYNECIKEQSNIGETIYHNVCTNETYSIKWGSDTWVGIVFATTIVVLFIIILIVALIKFIFD